MVNMSYIDSHTSRELKHKSSF